MEHTPPPARVTGGAKRKNVGKRPTCAEHPGNRVWIAGRRRRWSAYHEHQEFFCVDRLDKKSKHRIADEAIGRHPAEHNPAGGESCPHCEHVLHPTEGPRVGRDYTFGFREQAALLVKVGEGGPANTLRKASRSIRQRAFRVKRTREMRVPKDGPRNYTARKEPRKGSTSKEPALAMAYVDQFAPIIVAELIGTKWPKVIALDSKPYKRRELVEDPENPGAGTYNSNGKEYGEIMAAVDHTVRFDGQIFAIHLEGGKDQSSWEAFFRSRSGAPEWVVADQDPGLEAAMTAVWPDTILYNCDQHLRMNARDYLISDGIPLQRVKARIGEPPDQQIIFEPHRLHMRLAKALQTRKGWDRFKAGVEKWVAADKVDGIRKWIRDTEPLVLYQMDLRAAHPQYHAVANGAVEGYIKAMNHAIGYRVINFKNAARLQKVFALITLQLRNVADEAVYAKILADHFAAVGGRPAPKWKDARVGVGRAPTIDGVVAYSTHRNAIRKVAASNRGRAERSALQRESTQAALDPLGLTVLTGRKRRIHGSNQDYYPVNGRVVSDYVEPQNLRDEWDTERNDRDPSKTKGSHYKLVWWVCREHSDGPDSHLHRWQATVVQRATRQTGCPFCMNREACPWNSLGKTRPDIAKDWDVVKNGDKTPFDVLAGGTDEVWFHCDRDSSHPSYKTEVQHRTVMGNGCTKAHPKDVAYLSKMAALTKARHFRVLSRKALPAPPDLGLSLFDPEPLLGIEPAVVTSTVVQAPEQGMLWTSFDEPPAAA